MAKASVSYSASAGTLQAGLKSGGLKRLKMNSRGVISILKSSRVREDLKARGARIQSALPTGDGEKWEAESFTGHDRVQVVVRTGNAAARETQAEQNPLIRALDRGR